MATKATTGSAAAKKITKPKASQAPKAGSTGTRALQVGDRVNYAISEDDAEEIRVRRVNSNGVLRGNPVAAGEIRPATVVNIWPNHEGAPVNLQVPLDGNDSLWVRCRSVDAKKAPGTYHLG